MWHQIIKDNKVRYFERYKDADGKTRTASVTYKAHNSRNEKAAHDQLTRIIAEKSRDKSDGLSFGELCDMYCTAMEQNLKASSLPTVFYLVRTLKELLGKRDAAEIGAGTLQKALMQSGYGLDKQNQLMVRFKAVYNWAYRMDLVQDIQFLDKIQKVKTQGKDPAGKYLESYEIEPIRQNIDPASKQLFDFSLLTGCRFGEVAALHIEDIDLKNRTIHIHRTFNASLLQEFDSPKTTSSNRVIFIQDQLLPLCEELMEGAVEGDLLFRPRLINNTFNRHLKRACKGVTDKNVTPHTLRHTHCSLLAEAGIPLEQISRRLGHEDSGITREVYLHVTEKAKDRENDRIRKLKLI